MRLISAIAASVALAVAPAAFANEQIPLNTTVSTQGSAPPTSLAPFGIVSTGALVGTVVVIAGIGALALSSDSSTTTTTTPAQ